MIKTQTYSLNESQDEIMKDYQFLENKYPSDNFKSTLKMGKNETNNPILTKEKSEIFSVDKCREDILDVEKEVQSIIKNSTQMKKIGI